MKTLNERMALAYPDGEPVDQSALLRGDVCRNPDATYRIVEASATAARNTHTAAISKLRKLEGQLARRRVELDAIITELVTPERWARHVAEIEAAIKRRKNER